MRKSDEGPQGACPSGHPVPTAAAFCSACGASLRTPTPGSDQSLSVAPAAATDPNGGRNCRSPDAASLSPMAIGLICAVALAVVSGVIVLIVYTSRDIGKAAAAKLLAVEETCQQVEEDMNAGVLPSDYLGIDPDWPVSGSAVQYYVDEEESVRELDVRGMGGLACVFRELDVSDEVIETTMMTVSRSLPGEEQVQDGDYTWVISPMMKFPSGNSARASVIVTTDLDD